MIKNGRHKLQRCKIQERIIFFPEFSYEPFIPSYFKTMLKIILNSFPLTFQDMKVNFNFVIHCIKERLTSLLILKLEFQILLFF